MPIDAPKVRELAALGEGPTLDFKRTAYDLARAGINAELAKDLMAIGNELRLGGTNGYILLGVEDDGTIVGIAPTTHHDDGDLHRRVTPLLNATPRFSYSVTDVDGMSIGVIEIEPGGRPFFPVRNSPPLVRRLPVHRNGSITDEASPLHVLTWAREDDPDEARLRAFDLAQHEAERQIYPRLTADRRSAGPDGLTFKYYVRNLGRRVIQVIATRWRVEWKKGFYDAVGAAITSIATSTADPDDYLNFDEWRDGWSSGIAPAGYVPPRGEQRFAPVTLPVNQPLGLGHDFDFKFPRDAALHHFKQASIPVAGFSGDWAIVHLEVDLVSELGSVATATLTVA